MKRFLLIFALLLGAVSSWGQTVADQAAVLQKCIDLQLQVVQNFQSDPVSQHVSGYALEAESYFNPTICEMEGIRGFDAFGYWHCSDCSKPVNPLALKMQRACRLSTNLETSQTRR